MFVKPGANAHGPGGLHVVRVPRTHAIMPPEGMDVPDTIFWHRRVIQGDVVLVDPPSPPAEGHVA